MVINIVSSIFIFAGVFFFLVGVVGLLRFPDVYTRLHATTKCDTLGAGLMLLGLAIQGELVVAGKLILIIVLIWIANPTAAHVIGKASYYSGIAMTEDSFDLDVSSKEEGVD